MSIEEVKAELQQRISSNEMIAVELKATSKMIGNLYLGKRESKNMNSWRLLERLGFQREAFLKQNVYFWKDENGNPI